MAKNPFAKEAPEATSETMKFPEELLPGGNYCPFVQTHELGFAPTGPVDAKAVLANPMAAQDQAVQPFIGPRPLRCFGEKCSFWHAPKSGCSLKLAAVAQIEAAEALKSLAAKGAPA